MSNIRLHIPAIPYTITRSEFSHDAYTGKVQRFSPMMRSRGFEVYHYGVETSESGATKQIDIMTKQEWTELRIKTWQFLDASLNWEQATQKNNDPTIIVSALSNWCSPLAIEFNKRFREALQKNYRSCQTDIVCLPLGKTHLTAIEGLDIVLCESGIGYSDSFANYRIFESHTWMSHTLAKEDKQPQNYWFVVPNYYDTQEFTLSLVPKNPIRIGFMGRISDFKGCRVISEIARRFLNIEFVICGQGDPAPYLTSPNMRYLPPLHGSQRSDFMGSCTAFLHLPIYDEPFGGAAVEAQLCGTPVISTDWGAMTQTIEQFKTGLRGHTLADFCKGVQMAIDGKFDRQYIRDRATMLYDMYAVAPQFENVFKSILDVHTPGKNGWYSLDCHMMQLVSEPLKKKDPRIYIIIPYYGAFPNYFQLFLYSVGINTDILTVILITDIDLSPYRCPSNLVVISMTKEAVQIRAATFIRDTYGKSVEPKELFLNNYKFVDFKIVYPKLFDDILKEQGATEIDYVGWGDCDLIYGRLSNFIKFEEKYGILGGWHGHFTAIQNTDSFKNNFKRIPNYLDLITDNSQTYVTDEIAYREYLIAYINENNIKIYFANRDFCDIIPPCYYHLWRPDWASWKKNFFDLHNANKNINYLYYNNSTLNVVYDDGSQRETLYCHLQKRKMELPFQDYTDGYYITEHAFAKELITESPANPAISDKRR